MRSQDTITVPAVDELEGFTQTFYAAHGFMPIAGAEAQPAAAEPAPAATPAPTDAGADAGAEATPAAPDLSAVMSRLDQVVSRLPEPEAQTPQTPDPQAETDAWLDKMFGPDPAAAAQAAQEIQPGQPGQQQQLSPDDAESVLRDMVQAQVNPVLRNAMAPVLNELNGLKQANQVAEVQQIITDFPEWKDPAQIPELQQEVQFWAQEAGDPNLTRAPWFMELVTQARRGAESGSREVTPGQQPQTAGDLQPAGQARPGGEGQPDRWSQVKAAGPSPQSIFR